MSVRRLAPAEVQPKEFAFTAENLDWAKKQLTKFPEGRQQSAVIPLMWRAQEQHHGWLPEAAIRTVADMIGMEYIRALEVATFYTMFLLQPVGKKAHVQVCGTTPCRLRGADALFDICHKRIAHEPFELSADGNFSWEEVECLGACVNAPMALIWKDTYEDLTPETFERLLDGFAAGQPPKPGPQIDRQFSAPEGGPTTLTDKTIYETASAGGDNDGAALTDNKAKKPTKAASERESPVTKNPKP
ncbi:MAG: NADH-quinone oxidoreductase subunit NuoE [Pseudolabrys sp.]|nr:NADH-quinone oxidoreductase subunit NuoE [Pseudolabrys sp.]MDP2294675.1 NADH-quinone oxidoreductase subunit NuoE [Pseudolabrys sp.]